jgi:hypothetical protein
MKMEVKRLLVNDLRPEAVKKPQTEEAQPKGTA